MHGLDIVGMIISTRAAHAFRTLMVWDHVVVIGEPLIADCADAFLFGDLAVQDLSHLTARPQFPIAPRVVRIIDAPNTQSIRMRVSSPLPTATKE